jgi:hypothetical protein
VEGVVVVLTGAPALLLACPLITCKHGQSARKVWRHCKFGTLIPIPTVRTKLFYCSHTDRAAVLFFCGNHAPDQTYLPGTCAFFRPIVCASFLLGTHLFSTKKSKVQTSSPP